MAKEILVVEFSTDPATFVRNVFRAYDVRKVEIEDRDGQAHATVTVAATEKGRAIGREGKNLRVARDLIARHHAITSVSVA
jgi:N utilization substance protein A